MPDTATTKGLNARVSLVVQLYHLWHHLQGPTSVCDYYYCAGHSMHNLQTDPECGSSSWALCRTSMQCRNVKILFEITSKIKRIILMKESAADNYLNKQSGKVNLE